MISMVAGTVWVQMGQWTRALTPFSMTACMVISPLHHIGRKNRRAGCSNLQRFAKGSQAAVCVNMAL
jgi:hypothetical protein